MAAFYGTEKGRLDPKRRLSVPVSLRRDSRPEEDPRPLLPQVRHRALPAALLRRGLAHDGGEAGPAVEGRPRGPRLRVQVPRGRMLGDGGRPGTDHDPIVAAGPRSSRHGRRAARRHRLHRHLERGGARPQKRAALSDDALASLETRSSGTEPWSPDRRATGTASPWRSTSS